MEVEEPTSRLHFSSLQQEFVSRLAPNNNRIRDLFYPREPGKKEFWVEFSDLREQLTFG